MLPSAVIQHWDILRDGFDEPPVGLESFANNEYL